jgi:hypothetical protein
MAQEVRSPAAYAADIDAAKDRMISFVDGVHRRGLARSARRW